MPPGHPKHRQDNDPPPGGRGSAGKGGPGDRGGGSLVAVLGIGQMGLVCAGILSRTHHRGDSGEGGKSSRAAGAPHSSVPGRGQHSVILWGHSLDEAGELTQTRRSDRLPGFTLPDSVRVTSDLAKSVADADLVVCSIPVQFKREVWTRLRGKLAPGVGIVSVAKGIENKTLLRPTQIIADALRDDPDAKPRSIGALSGPTIASELARGLPATMIAASDSPEFSLRVQQLFSTSYLRVYTNEDLLGVELAGAMKNVIAIAAGVIDGLQAGYNAKSALLARGLAEITRLGTAMGASTETFFGLAGVGDLATTCFSPEGRNRTLGEALGRGEKLDVYLGKSQHVVEGVATTRSVVDLALKYRVDMPIAQAVHAVLFEGLDPIEGIGRLMSREQKAERVG